MNLPVEMNKRIQKHPVADFWLVMWLGALLLYPSYLSAQSHQLTLDEEFAPVVKVTGTSSLHDWTVTSGSVEAVPQQLELTLESEQALEDFTFKVLIAKLDGGRGPSMNGKIKAAFKATEYPYISYRQTGPASVKKASDGDHMEIISKGVLSMAGQEKEITVSLKGLQKGSQLHFIGMYPMKMSDFSMEPPTAMFGQIKTHDEVVVHFEFRYNIKP